MKPVVYNHQDRSGIELDWLQSVAAGAVSRCLESPGVHSAPLRDLEEIEISLLADAEIERINEEYLEHEGPTDVITFDHGEILLGVGVAADNASVYGKSLSEELALYVIHGLLHLNGWEDKDPGEAAAMADLQEKILRAVVADTGGSPS